MFLSRDLDSRFSAREVAAVDEWLSIGMPLHSIRDHPNHNTPLLGKSGIENLAQTTLCANLITRVSLLLEKLTLNLDKMNNLL